MRFKTKTYININKWHKVRTVTNFVTTDTQLCSLNVYFVRKVVIVINKQCTKYFINSQACRMKTCNKVCIKSESEDQKLAFSIS
jgi:hypothetical protein